MCYGGCNCKRCNGEDSMLTRDLNSKVWPMLFGMSSNGSVKQWSVYVTEHSSHSVISIEHGKLGGKLQWSEVKISAGKNIGRSNETTHFEQACLEAESKWKKQHDKNYGEKVPTSSESEQSKLLPMLAQKYNERKNYIVWPAYVQPKLNGVRCLVERKGDKIFYWSRKAKPYKNFNLYMDHEFLSFMEDGEILDGEMYNHGDLTFQELISEIKDEKTPDVERLKKYVKFHCYDHAVEDQSFTDRYVKWAKTAIPNGVNYIRLVDTKQVQNEKEMMTLHGIWTERGYEGTIVRSGGHEGYVFQYRDNQLQKYKDFVDEEFKIVGCKEGVGKDEGKAIFSCESSGGTFDVRCKGTDAMREEQWKNRRKYIGKQLTVRYQTLSDAGIPIFPVGITVRDYE